MVAIAEQLQRDYEMQLAISSLLELSLRPGPLNELLAGSLDLLLGLPWLALETKGCVFLFDEGRQTLHMIAERGMPRELLERCASVAAGYCLCGQAAGANEVVFASHVDARHTTITKDMKPHGHYCIPISTEHRVLGVLNLYLSAGHERRAAEERFLLSVAKVLSGLIERKRGEEALCDANDQLEHLLRDRTSSLDQLRSQQALILDAVGDGVFGLDVAGVVTFVNPATATALGYAPAELVGQSFHELVHHSRADGTRYPREECPIAASLAEGNAVRVPEERFWRKDGTDLPVEYVVSPLRDGTTFLGAVVTFRDITERRALDQMKSDFVSTVSHELRTPLTSIRGSLGLLEGAVAGELPEKALSLIRVARRNTDRLIRLINSMLDLDKIEAGSLELQLALVSIDEIVSAGFAAVDAMAREAQVLLRYSARPSLRRVRADRDRLIQVLTNLLANAIAYSPVDGTVLVAAEQAERSEDVRVTVTDEGPGIPFHAQGRLFERFQQVGPSDDPRRRSGTGLGLAISRAIVEDHGGTIGVESDPGHGSTFFFTLPGAPSGSSGGAHGRVA